MVETPNTHFVGQRGKKQEEEKQMGEEKALIRQYILREQAEELEESTAVLIYVQKAITTTL